MGHVRDLPKSKLGVDVENDFAPQYVLPARPGTGAEEAARRGEEGGTMSTSRPTRTERARPSPGTWPRR